MKEYIDKEDIINFLKGIEALHYNDELRINILNGINDISSTVDVVEREKIDKAIEELKREKVEIAGAFDDDFDDGLELILDVLKRNIGESEGYSD